MKVGYARVSTKGQTPENQISELAETGCELFFEEKTSGAKKRRPALEAVLEQIRADDIVGVTSLDRLTRSTPELLRIAEVFIKRTDTSYIAQVSSSVSGKLTDFLMRPLSHEFFLRTGFVCGKKST